MNKYKYYIHIYNILKRKRTNKLNNIYIYILILLIIIIITSINIYILFY